MAGLLADPDGAGLVRGLASYDENQIAFHRLHLGLAATQLRKVGVEVGTGGTSFKTYLKTYENLCAPLFPELRAIKEHSALDSDDLH